MTLGALRFVHASLQAFAKAFSTTPDDLDMHVVYDVSHNIAKVAHRLSRPGWARPGPVVSVGRLEQS